MNRSAFIRTAIAAALAVLGVAGCGSMHMAARSDILEATLSPAQEVPPTRSSGSGQAEVQYVRETGTLKWKVTYSGLSGPATGGHIHGPAAAGANAGVVVPFTGDLNRQPIQGETRITSAQAGDLLAGLWYVNLHTAANPAGEIRGQLALRR